MQRDMAALACHSLGAADFGSCFWLQRGSFVHEHYSGGGAAGCGDGLPWHGYSGGGVCHYGAGGMGVVEQEDGGARDERKERRLASNRESARRSRVRRRRQLDELSVRVAELRDANARLAVQLNRVMAAHARTARENARLREEQRDLQERLAAAEAATAKEEAGDEAGTPAAD
ncbi:hypothetical protein EJB05_41625, partial [Eragrostis curvula]